MNLSLQRSKQLEAKIAINMMLDVCSDKFICQSPNSAEIHSIHPFHLDFLNTHHKASKQRLLDCSHPLMRQLSGSNTGQ